MNFLKKYYALCRMVAVFFVMVLVAQALIPALTTRANAAPLSSGMVRFDRMNASEATTGTVCAKTNGAVQTEGGVGVTFPTGYTVSGTHGNWAVDTGTTTGWPAGANAWVGIVAPAADAQISGQTVVFGSGNLVASTLYCFNWTSTAALSVKGSATSNNTGVITTCTATANCAGVGGTSANLDTITYATASLANNCGSGAQACDQIQVSASIGAAFTFSLSSTTAAIGALSTSSPASATPVNATVSTNATNGWQMWAADLAGTPGLTSVTAPHTIAYSPTVGSAAAALSNGVEGYNLGAGTASGTTCTAVSDDGNFASSGTPFKGGGLDGTMRSLAVSTGIANACSLPLTLSASISPTTPPATDYAGTVTVVAAGSF